VAQASRRWRNLGIAAGAATATLFAAFDVYQWLSAYAADHFHNDFTFYYAAARIGWSHGWSSIYDLAMQQAQLNAMGSGITIAELARYISPPPVAWLALPLTALPYPVAYWAWCVLLLVALGLTWLWASPGAGRVRVIYLLAAVGWLPVIYGLQLGQPGLFVAAGVAGSYALMRANRRVWAGVALGALALKPQLAFLLPLALLAARENRAFAGTVIALGALALISAIALGPSGVSAYVDRLNFAATVPVNRELTLGVRAAEIFIAAWTILIANRLRHRGVGWVYGCALVGGMLATPYAHLDDLAILGLAAWLVLRSDPPRWAWVYILAAVFAIEGEPIWGPMPVIASEIGGLALLSLAAVRSRAGLTLPQIDARPLELRPKQ
jgi:glycosyl transferase family 87